MKNLLLLFSLSALIISCGGDDSVVGSYSIISFGSPDCGDIPITLDFDNGDGCDEFAGIEVCASGVFTLREDGTFTSALIISSPLDPDDDLFEIDGSGTWIDNGSSISLCDSVDDCVTARKSGDLLIVDIDDDDCSTVVELRKN